MTKVTLTLPPGLEPMVRELAAEMFGEEARNEPLDVTLSQLLPLLISNALAGDVPTGDADAATESQTEAPAVDVKSAIEDALGKMETPDPRLENLEMVEQENSGDAGSDQDSPALTFGELEEAEVYPAAMQWAKGDPLKERALALTLTNMPSNMWTWPKVLELAKRAYDMKGGTGGETDPNP